MTKSKNKPFLPTSQTHKLKCDHDHYLQLIHGLKTFEFRKNDRDFKALDYLEISELNPNSAELSGRSSLYMVTHMLDASELSRYTGSCEFPAGYCIMSIRYVNRSF